MLGGMIALMDLKIEKILRIYCTILLTPASMCVHAFQCCSLPQQWATICHVALEDFPEGSRCSFIKLSSRVESKGKEMESTRKKKEKEREEKKSGEIDGCEGGRGWLSWARRQTLP